MESSIVSFRRVIRQAWSRRVFLIVSTATPPLSLDRLTVDYITSLRDPEWEEQERSYHETALSEVNLLVRKYNAMAPYIARRALHTRHVELERMYNESAKEIHGELLARLRSGKGDEPTFGSGRNDEDDDPVVAHGTPLPSLSVWTMFKELFTWVRSFSILWRFTEASHSDVGLELGIRNRIDGLVRHRDGGADCDWRGKIREPGSSGADMMEDKDASVRG